MVTIKFVITNVFAKNKSNCLFFQAYIQTYFVILLFTLIEILIPKIVPCLEDRNFLLVYVCHAHKNIEKQGLNDHSNRHSNIIP